MLQLNARRAVIATGLQDIAVVLEAAVNEASEPLVAVALASQAAAR